MFRLPVKRTNLFSHLFGYPLTDWFGYYLYSL